jgi:hypothetical protein
MKLGPLLRAHAYMNVERPPELWDVVTDDYSFIPLLGEMIAASLGGGLALADLTLNASNVVIEPSEEGEPDQPSHPTPGEYVAISVTTPADLGPDSRWYPGRPPASGLLHSLNDRLLVAETRFAYIRRLAPRSSFTVFLDRDRSDPP